MTLRVLLAAIEEGNLARAAARERIAVSAVSRRISDLEARFGVTLLHRHDRGVEPSAAALMIVDRIRGMFDLLQQIVEDIGEVRHGTRGLIRLRAHMTASAGVLPDLLAEFLSRHPGIDVQFEEATSGEIVHAVKVGTCDLGFVSGTTNECDVQMIPWAEDELVAILPAISPLRDRDSLTLAELLDFPFVGMQRDSALIAMCRSQAAAMGRSLVERAHVGSFEIVRKMVGCGLGVAILPADAARPFVSQAGIVAVPLAESWARRPLLICVREKARLSAATRLLIETLLPHADA